MTLIAAIRVDGFPILLGDLLISSTVKPNSEIALPTVGKLSTASGVQNTQHIVGTNQKICVLHKHLAVAWAGRKIYARDIIRRMKRHFIHRNADEGSLREFFLHQNQKHLSELSLICLFQNEKGLSTLGINTTNIDTERYGHCQIGGVGQGDLISLLYIEGGSQILAGRPNPLERCVTETLALASNFIVADLTTATTLASGYGGGIEIATYVGEEIQKIGDILYMFWQFERAEKEIQLELVPIILKQDYINDDLIIRRIEFDFNDTLKDYSLFRTSPLLKTKSRQKLDVTALPDLNAKFLVNHAVSEDDRGVVRLRATVDLVPGRNGPVKISLSDDGLSLSFNHEFVEREMASLQGLYQPS